MRPALLAVLVALAALASSVDACQGAPHTWQSGEGAACTQAAYAWRQAWAGCELQRAGLEARSSGIALEAVTVSSPPPAPRPKRPRARTASWPTASCWPAPRPPPGTGPVRRRLAGGAMRWAQKRRAPPAHALARCCHPAPRPPTPYPPTPPPGYLPGGRDPTQGEAPRSSQAAPPCSRQAAPPAAADASHSISLRAAPFRLGGH